MTAVTLSTYDELLKTVYLDGIQDYLNNATILASILDVNSKDISGKNATIESHYGRSSGTGAAGDREALPTANYQKFKTCTVPMKYIYGRIEVTGPTIAATKDSRGAYGKALEIEVEGIMNDLKNEVNRMMWGCGYGVLARWRDGTTTMTLQKSYRNNSAGGDGFGSAFGGKYVDKRNDCVGIGVASLSASGTYVVGTTNGAISALTKGATYDTATMTDLAITEAVGSYLARKGSVGAYAASGAGRLEPMGIRGLVTDTDLDEIALFDGTDTGGMYNDPLQGLAVVSHAWFKSIVDSHPSGRYAGQRALDLTLIQTMFDMVEEQAGKDFGPNLMLTTRAVRREYLELMQADRQIVNKMELDGGWSALDYNGVPFVVDNDAIDGEIYFLTTKDIQVYQMSPYMWMEKDGAVLSRISGYDTYEAVLFRYLELGIKNRATQGVLTDIAYTKSSVEGYGR